MRLSLVTGAVTALALLAARAQAQSCTPAGAISCLPAASSLTGTELFETVQSGSRKATAAQIRTFSLQGARGNLTAVDALVTAADKLTYWSGSGAAALTACNGFCRSLLAGVDAPTDLTTLGGASLAAANTYAGINTFGAAVHRDGAAATVRGFGFKTSGANRGFIGVNDDAEAGSDAGSNLIGRVVTDAGVTYDAWKCLRATRVCNFLAAPTFTDASTTRTNLGLGSAATSAASAFDASGAATTAQAAAVALSAQRASNLSDLASASTARTNLGLGTLATASTVALASQVTGVLPIANGGRITRHPGYVSSRFYGPPHASTNTTAALAANTIYAQPWIIEAPTSLRGLGLFVQTGVAGVHCMVAVAANVSGAPGTTPLGFTATQLDMSASSTSVNSDMSADVVITTPGAYWLETVCDGAAIPATFQNTDSSMQSYLGWTSVSGVTRNTAAVVGVTSPGTYSSTTFPSFSTPTLVNSGPIPLMAAQIR